MRGRKQGCRTTEPQCPRYSSLVQIKGPLCFPLNVRHCELQRAFLRACAMQSGSFFLYLRCTVAARVEANKRANWFDVIVIVELKENLQTYTGRVRTKRVSSWMDESLHRASLFFIQRPFLLLPITPLYTDVQFVHICLSSLLFSDQLNYLSMGRISQGRASALKKHLIQWGWRTSRVLLLIIRLWFMTDE